MSRLVEILVVYVGGLAQGLALVSVPAAATILTAPDGYGFSSSQYGSIFLPLFLGSVLSSLLAPALSRRRSLKQVLLFGFGANALAMTTFALSASVMTVPFLAYGLVLLATGLLGVAFGSTLTAINAFAASLFPRRPETAITALHTLLGTGTALAPLIVSLLIGGGGWWLLPVSIAIAAVVLAGLGATQPLVIATAGTESAMSPGVASIVKALPGRFWGWIVFALLYGICETLFGNWGTVYLHQQRAVPEATANLALSVFWATVTVGRLLVAVLSARVPPLVIFRALPVMIALALFCVAVAFGPVLGVGAFALAGFACSACLPLSIGTASSENPRFVETASGWMVASYMMGYGIGAYAVGPLRQSANLQLSEVYLAAIGIALVMILLAYLLVRGKLPAHRAVVAEGAPQG